MAQTATSTNSADTSDSGAAEQAQEKAREVAGQAQEKLGDARQQMRGRLGEQVDQRSTRAGEQIHGTAEDVRSFARQLREQGKDRPARYAEQAADRAERLGGYLQEADGDRILRDVEDFGRRNPWAVVAAGAALGFVASRMLKASSGERYRSSLAGGGGDAPGGEGGARRALQPSEQVGAAIPQPDPGP